MKLKFKPISLFMVIVVILISSIVLFNSINYLSIIDSYLFIFYITLFELSMISFILAEDIIITSFYWDLLGLISYLPINFCNNGFLLIDVLQSYSLISLHVIF